MTPKRASLRGFATGICPVLPGMAEAVLSDAWELLGVRRGEEVGVDEREDGGGFVGGAAGDGGLHAGFAGCTPAEVADVPRAVGQGGGVDAGDVFYVEEFHGAARFGVATDAVGVEEEAFGGIGDGVEDLLDRKGVV